MKNPLVSVNMPVKNGEKHLKEAIQSILNQTFSDFELIVVNDGSTDCSVEIIHSFDDKRIRFFDNETGNGIASTRNFAIKKSLGKYIAIFDCDDVMLPDRLQKQVDFLEKNPDFALVGSSIETIDENGAPFGNYIYKLPATLIKTQLFFNNYFAQSTVMMRKNILENFFYDTNFVQGEDYLLWTQIAENYKVANLKDKLAQYRIHNQSISNVKKEQQQEFIKKVYAVQLSFLKIIPTENELENHFLLLKNPEKIDMDSPQFAEILQWSNLLKTQNKKLQIFDNHFFNKCIKRLFRKIYRKNLKKSRNIVQKIRLRLKICKTKF